MTKPRVLILVAAVLVLVYPFLAAPLEQFLIWCRAPKFVFQIYVAAFTPLDAAREFWPFLDHVLRQYSLFWQSL